MSDWQPKEDAAKALLCSHSVLLAGEHSYGTGLRGGSLALKRTRSDPGRVPVEPIHYLVKEIKNLARSGTFSTETVVGLICGCTSEPIV